MYCHKNNCFRWIKERKKKNRTHTHNMYPFNKLHSATFSCSFSRSLLHINQRDVCVKSLICFRRMYFGLLFENGQFTRSKNNSQTTKDMKKKKKKKKTTKNQKKKSSVNSNSFDKQIRMSLYLSFKLKQTNGNTILFNLCIWMLLNIVWYLPNWNVSIGNCKCKFFFLFQSGT